MPIAENRIAAAGDVIRATGPGVSKVLHTFKLGDPVYAIGINGFNINFTVGANPTASTFVPRPMTVTAGTAAADFWANGAKLLTLAVGTTTFNLPGNDLVVTVVAAPVTPTPPIVVGTSPFPLIKPGDNIEQALATGSRSLQPGAVYRLASTIDVTASGRTLVTADKTAAKPIIEVPGNFRAISVVGKHDFTLDGIEVRSVYTSHTEAGVWGFNAPNLRILNTWIHGFNKGVTAQADNLAAGGDFFLWDSWLADNTRQNIGGKDYHGAGVYCDHVRYDIRRVHLDHNGWREGQTSRDVFSHNFYGQGTCADGGVFEDVLSNDASSHGCQLRAGGSFKRYVALNCPIGFSFGLVNDSMIHPGGVKGAIEDVWVLGCPAISSTQRPGWAGEFGNILDVTANGIYADGDDLGTSKAFIVHACRNPQNAGYVGVKRLILNGLCAPKWKQGVLAENDGMHVTSDTIVQPAKYADGRGSLGAQFLANSRGKPSVAASVALALLHAAWGVN